MIETELAVPAGTRRTLAMFHAGINAAVAAGIPDQQVFQALAIALGEQLQGFAHGEAAAWLRREACRIEALGNAQEGHA